MCARVIGFSFAPCSQQRHSSTWPPSQQCSSPRGRVIGEDNDVLWIVDDIVFFGFILCAIALIALSAGVLVRSLKSSREA